MSHVTLILRNVAPGFRGIHNATGELVEFIPEQRQAVTLTKAEADDLPDYFEVVSDADDVEDLNGMKVADLKELARREDIDLGDATKKDDIVATIELAREARQAG